MQVYGFLTKAQIENASADLTNTLPGLIWFNTTDNKVRFYDNGAIRSVVDEDTVQDVANKTFESGAISNFLDFTHNTTPANPAAGSIRVYPKADNKLYKLDSDGFEEEIGTGGGQAGINYIENWNAEKDLDGVSINGTIPLALETADPLFGEKSFKVTGDGVTDFSGDIIEIDMLTVDGAVPYTMVSGEFWVRNQELSSGDMIVKIYDIDNAQYISLSEGKEIGASLLPSFTHSFAFQATDSLNYRVDVEIVDGSSAFEFVWDNIIVGPQKTRAIGAPVTDWEAYTPTFSTSVGTASNIFTEYRRVGSNLEIRGTFRTGTVHGANSATMTLPEGLSYGGDAGRSLVGHISRDEASAIKHNSVIVDSAQPTTLYFGPFNESTISPFTALAANAMWGSNERQGIVGTLSIPIAGWSSNVVLSETTSNREIFVQANVQSTQTMTKNVFETVIFGNEIDDTVGIYNPATGETTIPEDGTYDIETILFFDTTTWTAGDIAQVNLFVNGTNKGALDFPTVETTAGKYMQMSGTVSRKLVKDDVVTLQVYHNRTGGTANVSNGNSSAFSLKKTNTGSQTIAASEKVIAMYRDSSGQSIPDASQTLMTWDTKDVDTHNALTSGKFKAPKPGILNISGAFTFGDVTSLYTLSVIIYNYTKANYKYVIEENLNGSRTGKLLSDFAAKLDVNHGDEIGLLVVQDDGSTASRTLTPDGNYNFIEFTME